MERAPMLSELKTTETRIATSRAMREITGTDTAFSFA